MPYLVSNGCSTCGTCLAYLMMYSIIMLRTSRLTQLKLCVGNCARHIPYSRKIWRELNLANWPQPARTKILADFNLADG